MLSQTHFGWRVYGITNKDLGIPQTAFHIRDLPIMGNNRVNEEDDNALSDLIKRYFKLRNIEVHNLQRKIQYVYYVKNILKPSSNKD